MQLKTVLMAVLHFYIPSPVGNIFIISLLYNFFMKNYSKQNFRHHVLL